MLDYSMPMMNGLEVCQQIHARLESVNYPHRPFICCVTSSTHEAYKQRALTVGMDAFFKKPLSMEQVKLILKKAEQKYSEES